MKIFENYSLRLRYGIWWIFLLISWTLFVSVEIEFYDKEPVWLHFVLSIEIICWCWVRLVYYSI